MRDHGDQPAAQRAGRPAATCLGGRQAPGLREAYRPRNTVERAVNPLKRNRVVATRYDKRAVIREGSVQTASTRIRLRDLAFFRHPT
ncbi:hypothetical protein LG943_17915 [Streptomonospora sp. S1-112]|uniref:Transposase n=1 Tax=Streptomonospora mangrovi TaxID=2883123 RepID=A0A9X3NMH5_9ACTN|nr:hypothetical protein [Streptomonospora mangrovi]MDA0566177.1 hypothetical protein [Streptomonospora mangrovi]